MADGGDNDNGVIFEYNISTNIFTKKHDLSSTDGSATYGSMTNYSNGLFYGITLEGGIYSGGVIFEYNSLNNTYIKKYDFGQNGINPYGNLVKASNNMLYGMTCNGGNNNYGVIFEYNPTTNIYTKKFDFNGSLGANPYGSLIQANNGLLYGMTCNGGNNNYGVIFEYNPTTNTYSKKHDFDFINGTHPYGSLLQASNGLLYGMTYQGGASDIGVIFEYNPVTNSYTKKFEFTPCSDCDAFYHNGAYPYGSFIEASNGMLYGMTYFGGTGNIYGIIFEYNPWGSGIVKKYDFSSSDGANPYGNLIQASDGLLYGMTYSGGTYNKGFFFQFNPAINAYVKRVDFNTTNGKYPNGNLEEVSSVLLPIELLSFNADCAFEGVQLAWATATEKNNDFFTIEKSYDLVSWKATGTVNGAGNSNSIKCYRLNDATSTEEAIYYRLKQTDYDGSSTYSDVVYAKCTGNNRFNFNLSPNPARNQICVSLYLKDDENATLRITNIMGRIVLNKQLKLQKGLLDKYIEITGLPAGIYSLTVTGNNYSYSRKFVKN